MTIYPHHICDTDFDDESRDFCVYVNKQKAFVHRVYVDMHNVQPASFVAFDLEDGSSAEIEIECNISWAWRYKIRPESLNVRYDYDNRKIKFTLDKPVNISVEVNDDIVHNLHIFAQRPIKVPVGTAFSPGVHSSEISIENSVSILLPGVHFVSGCTLETKDNSSLYLCGGAVLVGSVDFSHVSHSRIYGNGMINLHQYPRYSCFNGITVAHSTDIVIEGITIVNPPHYSVSIGGSRRVGVKAFSCQGWSDGIDIMSSSDITIDSVFLRNSDDCIAIYAGRWDFAGDTRNIVVRNSILWADVAHPTTIGCHGNHHSESDIIENIVFENIDVLNHHEPQDDYTGVFAINVGDGNTARNILYKNITVEQYQRGRLIDLRVCRNPTYNPVPGKSISNVTFENICYTGFGELPSRICGYSEDRTVSGITFKNVTEHGRSIKENLIIGDYVHDLCFL